MDRPSLFPPFDDVLTRLEFGSEDETRPFDATIKRRSGAARRGQDAAGHLPELEVVLGGDSTKSSATEETDLQVAGLIGRGGMGEVWLARQRSLGRDVAIKTTLPDADTAVEHALVAEARVTGALEHPSIVPVHALGRAPSGQPVLVMKRIEGVAWRTLLREPDHPHWAHLGPEEPLVVHVQILMQLCNALELAHRRGFVHRDIKPANVMVGSFGEVYLVDWGLAIEAGRQSSEPRRIEGTPAYIAPEMTAGLPVDARTDVYLLGATLHEVLTGAPPHAGRSLAEVLGNGYEGTDHSYGSAPAELAALCREAMRREPSARPASARAFRDRLAAFLSHRASAAIVRRGRALLDELSQIDGGAVAAPAQRRALIEECLVTLRLALAEWPENPSARSALEDWRRIAVSVEIQEGQLAAARHLLEQMDDPPDELRRKLAELEQRVARQQQEADLGRRAAFEEDVRVGARERRLVGFLFMLSALLVAVISTLRPAELTSAASGPLLLVIGPAAVFALLFVVLRRRLLGNAFARRSVALLALLLALMLVHRTMAWVAGQAPHHTFVAESLMVAGVCGTAGMMLARWWLAGLALGLGAALLGIWNPAWAAPAYRALSLLLPLVAAVSWWRDARRSA